MFIILVPALEYPYLPFSPYLPFYPYLYHLVPIGSLSLIFILIFNSFNKIFMPIVW